VQAAAIHYATQELEQELIGWKIGAASEKARSMLGLDRPFFGPIFKSDLRSCPGSISPAFAPRGAEAEFMATMERALPGKSSGGHPTT